MVSCPLFRGPFTPNSSVFRRVDPDAFRDIFCSEKRDPLNGPAEYSVIQRNLCAPPAKASVYQARFPREW